MHALPFIYGPLSFSERGNGRSVSVMSRFLSTLEAAGGLDIIGAVYIGIEKYLLFTWFTEAESQWQIGLAVHQNIHIIYHSNSTERNGNVTFF